MPCSLLCLQQFDEKVLNTGPNQKVQEKKKKEAFKKLVNGIIGVRMFSYSIFFTFLIVLIFVKFTMFSKSFT